MDYENASDFEINKAVAKCLYKDCIELEVFQNTYKASTADVVSQGVHVTSFDFNNPSDAWSIIVGNNISIEMRGDLPALAYVKGDAPYDDKNPLRAAMIVYLMMKEAK